MKIHSILASALIVTLAAGCTDQYGQPGRGVMSGGNINKQDVGTVAGAIGGGVLGNQIGGGSGRTIATIAGTLIGAGIGNSVGRSLDNADRAALQSTTQRALEYSQPGETLPWAATNSGSVMPGNYYQNNGRYCREFVQRVEIGGQYQEAHGTACREPDGTWKVVQ